MLVLSRKSDEKLCIDNNITITVLKVRGGCVRLGIEAPANVRILRGELPDWVEALPTRPKRKARASEALAI